MINKFLSLVKFSHTIFALPFALIGFIIGISQPNASFNWMTLLCILLCMVFARNAAMAFNRWADASIDAKNIRTEVREIPAGKLSRNQVLFFILLNSIAFLITTYFINSLCFALAPFVLAIILGYSYTKRFTPFCHIVLGLGLAIAPIGAYLAVIPEWNLVVILIGFVVLTWVSGFDIIYALQDEEFDRENGLFSIPTFLGKRKALFVSSLLHVICSILLVYIGFLGEFGLWYFLGVTVFVGLLIYQHLLVKPNDLSKVDLAFFTTNGIASVVFFVFVAIEILI